MRLEWDGSLAIDNDKIDAQHRKLVEIVNQLHADRLNGAEPERIRSVIMELFTYALAHFREEERLMLTTACQDYEAHKAEHDGFVAKLESLAERVNAGDETVAGEAFNWLVGWLLDHISVTDQRLAAFLARR